MAAEKKDEEPGLHMKIIWSNVNDEGRFNKKQLMVIWVEKHV